MPYNRAFLTPYLPSLYGERSSTWLEHQIVDLGVAGSIPVAHPSFI